MDAWEFEALMNVVTEFQEFYQAGDNNQATFGDLPGLGDGQNRPNREYSPDPRDAEMEKLTVEAIN